MGCVFRVLLEFLKPLFYPFLLSSLSCSVQWTYLLVFNESFTIFDGWMMHGEMSINTRKWRVQFSKATKLRILSWFLDKIVMGVRFVFINLPYFFLLFQYALPGRQPLHPDQKLSKFSLPLNLHFAVSTFSSLTCQSICLVIFGYVIIWLMQVIQIEVWPKS